MTLPRVILCCVFASVSFLSGQTFAQPGLVEINQKTLTLLSGEGQWFGDALSLSRTISHLNGMRILPVYGEGCIESAADVLQLQQVDVALLTADCVNYAQGQGLLPGVDKKLTYIARIRAVPLLLVASRAYPNVTALAGKRIATGPANSGAFASGELIFGGLELPFVRVARSGRDALDGLQRGESDAVLLQGTEALDGRLDARLFHVLGLTAPQDLASQYAPALVDTFSGRVETISTSLLLAVFNWPKQSAKAQKIKQFAKSYFAQEVKGDAAPELSASVPGWQRNETSQRALDALTINTQEIQQGDGP